MFILKKSFEKFVNEVKAIFTSILKILSKIVTSESTPNLEKELDVLEKQITSLGVSKFRNDEYINENSIYAIRQSIETLQNDNNTLRKRISDIEAEVDVLRKNVSTLTAYYFEDKNPIPDRIEKVEIQHIGEKFEVVKVEVSNAVKDDDKLNDYFINLKHVLPSDRKKNAALLLSAISSIVFKKEKLSKDIFLNQIIKNIKNIAKLDITQAVIENNAWFDRLFSLRGELLDMIKEAENPKFPIYFEFPDIIGQSFNKSKNCEIYIGCSDIESVSLIVYPSLVYGEQKTKALVFTKKLE